MKLLMQLKNFLKTVGTVDPKTNGSIDERDFSVPGVKLNAEISKELLQTIFSLRRCCMMERL